MRCTGAGAAAVTGAGAGAAAVRGTGAGGGWVAHRHRPRYSRSVGGERKQGLPSSGAATRHDDCSARRR